MKQYNGEKAIISLTSWKARINTVGKTLYSLLSNCPGFHIVLVLAEEEFPLKETELPEELMLFVDNDLIEILWVQKNYKAFKKILFTMDKYRTVPIISADDDCIYKYNYAERMYSEWNKNDKKTFVSIWGKRTTFVERNNFKIWHNGGAGTLYPPYIFGKYGLLLLTDKVLSLTDQDDDYYSCLKILLKLNKCIVIGPWRDVYEFHDEECPLHDLKKVQSSRKSRLLEEMETNFKKLK